MGVDITDTTVATRSILLCNHAKSLVTLYSLRKQKREASNDTSHDNHRKGGNLRFYFRFSFVFLV